jgi:hypothetical protein
MGRESIAGGVILGVRIHAQPSMGLIERCMIPLKYSGVPGDWSRGNGYGGAMMDFNNVIWQWAREADKSAVGAVNRPLRAV